MHPRLPYISRGIEAHDQLNVVQLQEEIMANVHSFKAQQKPHITIIPNFMLKNVAEDYVYGVLHPRPSTANDVIDAKINRLDIHASGYKNYVLALNIDETESTELAEERQVFLRRIKIATMGSSLPKVFGMHVTIGTAPTFEDALDAHEVIRDSYPETLRFWRMRYEFRHPRPDSSCTVSSNPLLRSLQQSMAMRKQS